MNRTNRFTPIAALFVLGVMVILSSGCSPASPDADLLPSITPFVNPSATLEKTVNPVKPGSVVSQELQSLVEESAMAMQDSPNQPFQPSNNTFMLNEEGTSVAVRITAEDIEKLLPSLQILDFEILGSQPELNFVEGFISIDQVMSLDILMEDGILGVVAIPRPQTGNTTP